jgi:hypothetical protein
MKSLRFGVLSCLLTALAFAGACSAEDDQLQAANSGGSPAGSAGTLHQAGASANHAGSKSDGGSGSVIGGTTSDVGVTPDAGGTLGSSLAGAGSREPTEISEQLGFCPRLVNSTKLAYDVTQAYRVAVYNDCRVRWVVVPANAGFLANLQAFNLRLWGCQSPPLSEFGLVPASPISQGDAAILIAHYITESSRVLAMSTAEVQDMQLALDRLGSQAIVGDSLEPSSSSCPEGGAGGASGNPTAGGSPGSAGAGGWAAETAGGKPRRRSRCRTVACSVRPEVMRSVRLLSNSKPLRCVIAAVLIGLAPRPLLAQSDTKTAVAEALYRQGRDLMAAGKLDELAPSSRRASAWTPLLVPC